MASSNFIALLAVQQNVSNLQEQLNFYGTLEYIIDDNAELIKGSELPDVWFRARGVMREDLHEVRAIRLPGDPYMHIWMYSWHNLVIDDQWPQKFNQVGSRGMTLLFDDAEVELARLQKEFPDTKVLHEAIVLPRRWGCTKSILVQDPEGTFVELISITNNPMVANAAPPRPDHRSFLHFMMNCVNFEATTKWYQSFGLAHDHGVDFRDIAADDQFNCGIGGRDTFMAQMKAFSHNECEWTNCHFLRGSRDPSHMHLELLEYKDNGKLLKNPGLNPTWFQKGIARYCMKTADFYDARTRMVDGGAKICIEEQRGALVWGDSQWFLFEDKEGNLLTLEQWYPHRYWGERG